jgi:hypothetical protein
MSALEDRFINNEVEETQSEQKSENRKLSVVLKCSLENTRRFTYVNLSRVLGVILSSFRLRSRGYK